MIFPKVDVVPGMLQHIFYQAIWNTKQESNIQNRDD